MSKKFVNRLGALALRSAISYFEGKSWEDAEAKGAALGRLAYRVSKKHRLIADINLSLAYPEWSAQERQSTAIKVMEHFGRVMAQFTRSGNRSDEEVLSRVECQGFDRLVERIKSDHGGFIISGHFGNWELLSQVLCAHGMDVGLVARDANDADTESMIRKLRTATGASLISRGDAAVPSLERVRKGKWVAMLPDQNSEEIFVPFFGHPCGTVRGPAILSLRSKMPLFPVYCVWVSPGRYRAWVEEPPIPKPGFEPVEGLTRALNTSLERAIRQAPEQYLWIHNRWKSARRRGLVP